VEQLISHKELDTLISLLDDNEVWPEVADKILGFGLDVVPNLEKTWETTQNSKLQERLENIIQEVQFRNVCHDLINWDLMGGKDLLNGACIVARVQYPELKIETLFDSISNIHQNIWAQLNDDFTAYEKVKIINHEIYNVQNFSGNYSNYFAPQNNYVNKVLETHKGNPISLGIIYLALAKFLELPIYGINLPKHFILAYRNLFAKKREDSILFYINPYNKGAILSKSEIENFLDQQQIKYEDSYFYPCNNYDIIERLLHNLINSYETIAQLEKIQKINKMLKIIKRK
jgi:regulator of sirC expression with transglutaminase-like and TPR domain